MYKTQAPLSQTIFNRAVRTPSENWVFSSKGITPSCNSSVTEEQPRFC